MGHPAAQEDSLSAADDAALARAAASGDQAAFAVLVRRHERRVRSFLRRLAGDAADDIAQEAFVRAWRAAACYRGEGSYEGWLLRIAWRLFLSARAEASRNVDTAEAQQEEQAGADPNLRLDVERALARLPARERAAASLCFGEGFSHGQASEILGMPLGTLKSVVARARAALLNDLKEM